MRTETFFKPISISVILWMGYSFCLAQIPEDFIFWKFGSGAYCNAPVIQDSVMYCGSIDGNFYALNRTTGNEIWRYNAGYEITSTAAVQDGIVCFESGNKLFGLSTGTGELIWNFVASDKLPTPGYPTGYHHSSPVIYNDVAYFGDEWGNMNGVNLFTGELVFQYTITISYTDETDYNIRTKPAILDDIIYFGDYGAHVHAVSLTDSSQKWTHAMNSPRWDGSLVSEVVIRDSSVYIGGYNSIFSPLDVETGNSRWEFNDQNTFLPSTPAFYHDYLILGSTLNSNRIHCINVLDGNTIWSAKAKGVFFTKPVFVNDSILIMNSADPFAFDKTGVVYFVNCKNGEIINQLFINNATESYPVVSGDTLFLGISDGLCAINYKPYLVKNHTSDIEFDDSQENIVIDANQKLTGTYSMLNRSNFYDSVTVAYSVEGEDSKDKIKFTVFNKRLIKPFQSLDFGFNASENSLHAGSYSITFMIYSHYDPDELLFEKNISVVVNNASSVDLTNELKWAVYPNPATDFVILDLPDEIQEVRIYNPVGKLLFRIRPGSYENIRIPVYQLKAGLYIVTLIAKDKTTQSAKLIIE